MQTLDQIPPEYERRQDSKHLELEYFGDDTYANIQIQSLNDPRSEYEYRVTVDVDERTPYSGLCTDLNQARLRAIKLAHKYPKY